jgi:hypothetical protein
MACNESHWFGLTSDPSGEILRSDDDPKDYRRPHCPVAGDVGPADFEDACAGTLSRPGRSAIDSTPVRRSFFVDHGSLYLALQRLEDKKWISAKWGVSENNRKARFYSLTRRGREQLVEKTSEWERLTRAMGLILGDRVGPSGEEA